MCVCVCVYVCVCVSECECVSASVSVIEVYMSGSIPSPDYSNGLCFYRHNPTMRLALETCTKNAEDAQADIRVICYDQSTD